MKTGAALSFVVAAVVVVISIPMRAPAALSGDGFEIADNIVRGGVLHPPGFALQSWIHVLLAQLPFASAAAKAVALSLFGHALATFFLLEAGRALGARPTARISGALFFAFFPTTWPLGLEPEVFALAHALMAALLWQCARLWPTPSTTSTTTSTTSTTSTKGARVGEALLLGLLVALAAAQHPITVVCAPAFLASLAALLIERERRWVRFVAAGAVFVVVLGALELSLPLLHRGAVWPDAPVYTVRDVVDHFMRKSYGTFQLAAGDAATSMSSLEVLLRFLVKLPLHAALFVAGAVVVVMKRHRGGTFALATATAALVFLQSAAHSGDGSSYLERFAGTFVVPASLVIALALEALMSTASAKLSKTALADAFIAVVSFVMIASSFAVGHARADLSQRNEQDVFRRALAAELPAEAVWLAGTDREVLGGAHKDVDDAGRYPINPASRNDWYWREVVPRIEPRLPWPGGPVDDAALVELARSHRMPLASTLRSLIDPTNERAHLRGLLWIVDDEDTGDVDAGTVGAAVTLCSFVMELHARPLDAPGFGHATQLMFARGFDGAAAYAKATGDPRDFTSIARALEGGTDETTWRDGCARLQSAQQRKPVE